MKREEIIENLKKILNSDQIILDEKTRAQKAVDLYALRVYQRVTGWKPTLPLVVVKPKNTEEVSKIVKFCNENLIKLIPYGGGSGVLGGAETRDENAVVLDVSDLNKVEKINDVNLTITCGAGVFIKDLEKMVNENGYVLGHYPQSMDLAQMGGLVSTRSIGQFSTGYGGMEDLLVGLEGVLPNGDIVTIRPNPRKAAGPDLRHIFLGGEGALGIVTQVTVRVFPSPETSYKEAFRVKTMDQGFEIIRQIMRTGIKPSVIRLHDWLECSSKYAEFMEEEECMLIFRSDGIKELTECNGKIIKKIAEKNGAISAGSKVVDIWYKHRNDAADEYEEYANQGILVDTIEISAEWDEIVKIYHDTLEKIYYDEFLQDSIMFASGHSSHSYMNGTNVYFQFGAIPNPEATPEEIEELHRKIWDIVMYTTLEHGGSIAHHHGVGKHRAKYIKDELGNAYEMLLDIKKAFDPNEIMNPGSLVVK